MSKSRARFLAEVLGTTGLVKKSKSALAGADEVIDLSVLPSIPNSKLTNSSITINSSATSLGGSVTLTTANVAENTNLYYTDARARAAISISGNAISYNSSTGVLTSNFEEGPVFTSAVTANAGITVDNITIDGNEIDVSSGSLTLDVAGDIILDAAGNDVILKDNGTTFGQLTNDSGNLIIYNSGSQMLKGLSTGSNARFMGSVGIGADPNTYSGYGALTINGSTGSLVDLEANGTLTGEMFVDSSGFGFQTVQADDDIIFKGNDGGSTITALTLDMSAAGTAIFNSHVDLSDSKFLRLGNDADFIIYHDGSTNYVQAVKQDSDIIFRGNDGGTNFNALRLDMSDGGGAYFNNDIYMSDSQAVRFGDDQDFRIYSDGSSTYLANSVLNQDIYVQGRDSIGLYNMLTMDMSARKSTFGGIVTSLTGFERGNMFITQNEIDVSSGDLTLDVAGDILLDADGGNLKFVDAGVIKLDIYQYNSNLYFDNPVGDSDIIFQGVDGSTSISALTLDMSEAGAATFNSNVTVGGNLTVQGTTTTLNTANLQVEDKNITLNYGTGDTSGSANYAGITIQDAVDSSTNATINWHQSGAFFNFSHNINTDGYLQHVSYLYSRNDLRVLNSAGNGWNTWATRSNGNFNLNVGSIQATSGDIRNNSSGAETDALILRNYAAGANTATALKFFPTQSTSRFASIVAENVDGNNNLALSFLTSAGDTPTAALTLDQNRNAAFAGTISGGATTLTSSTNMLLTLNPTAGNYGGILFKYGGATKGASIYNSGMMVYGGESQVSTALQAGGQYGLFIHHSTRHVGIGMSNATPTSVLNVRGDGGVAGLTFKTEDASANETFFVQDGGRVGVRYYPLTVGIPSSTATASGAVFQVEEAGNIFVNSSGSVGFGTTDPLRSLDSRHGLNIFGTGGYTELMLRSRAGTAQNLGAWHWSIRGDVGGANDDLMLLRFTGGNSPSYAGTSMHIRNDNGYVGIGTNTGQPSYPLDVWNSGHSYIRAKSTSANTRAALLTTGEDSSGNEVKGYFGSVGDANEVEVASLTNHQIKFYVNNTPAKGMIIDTDGSIIPGARSGGAANLHLGQSAGLSMGSSASGNTLVGYNAGRLVSTATENTALGSFALEDSSSGSGNTAIGRETLMNNQSGYENTAVGKLAMAVNTTGGENVAIGNEALRLGNASKNTAVGFESGYQAAGGEGVFIGYHAGYGVTSGDENTLVGSQTMTTTTTATNNTAVGRMALRLNTGNNNTALGHQSMITNAGGEQNTAVGKSSLSSNSSGNYNTAIGMNAGFRNTTGDSNTFVGNTAGYECQTGHSNTAVGKSAFGFGSSTNTANGVRNVAIGMQSLFRITNGYDNSVLGYQAGINITSGHDNTLIGYGAGDGVTTSSNNTVLGADALSSVQGGSHNVAIGRAAMQSTGTNVAGCVAVGLDTLEGTTGSYNTAVGYRAGNAITSGAKNTIIGAYTGNSGGVDIRGDSNNIILSDGDANIRLRYTTDGHKYETESDSSTTLKHIRIAKKVTCTGSSVTKHAIDLGSEFGAGSTGTLRYEVSILGYGSGGANGLNAKYSVGGYSGHHYNSINYGSFGAGTIQNGYKSSNSTSYYATGLSYHPAVNMGSFIATGEVYAYVPSAQNYGFTISNDSSASFDAIIVVEGWYT